MPPVKAKELRPVLWQDTTTLQTILHKESYVLLLVGPSGHGKTHMLEECLTMPILTETSCDDQKTEDDTSQETFLKLLQMSLHRGLRPKQVVIDNIEGLDVPLKKILTSFVKK